MDDFAIDDLPVAIEWVSAREHQRITVLGNSQGGIFFQASLSGLTRSTYQNFFRTQVAKQRQAQVSGLAISGGSVSVSHEKNNLFYPSLLSVYYLIQEPLKNARLQQRLHPHATPHRAATRRISVLGFFLPRKNSTKKTRQAMLDQTLEWASAGVMIHFGRGIEKRSIRTAGKPADQIPYTSGLQNLSVPTVQVTYEKDPFAEPGVTERESLAARSKPISIITRPNR